MERKVDVLNEELLSDEEFDEMERELTEDDFADGRKAEDGPGIYELLEQEIMESLELSEPEKAKRLSKLLSIKDKKVNIMLTGSTGSGKSSTINALFDMEVAKVGVGVDPETDKISKFELGNLTIWDTPGLGDGIENDREIAASIIKKLNEVDEEGNPVIDMVIVVMDSSSKDLGTSYDIINNVLVPCLGKEAEKRVLIALNQADIAMKGKHWDEAKNEPDAVLQEFLKKKAKSVQDRIFGSTGLSITPICYCAGYKEEGGDQRKPYNLTKLLYYIVQAIPKEKRLALADHINDDEDNWMYDDAEADYRGGMNRSFGDAVGDGIIDGMETGTELGEEILGLPGMIIGGIIGAAVGGIKGVFEGIFA